MSENNAYIYGHYKADTDELFYIGKGTGRRAWDKSKRNAHWHNVVNKHGYTVKILYEDLSEEDAYSMERKLILEVGLENLTNMTEGGLGMTSEQAKKLFIMLRNDPEYKKAHMEGVKRRSKNSDWYNNQIIKNRKLAEDEQWKESVLNGRLEFLQDAERYNKWIERKSHATNRALENSEYKKKLEDTKEHVKKEATLVSPTGELFHFRGVKKFAREQGLDYTRIARVIRGERKSHKGWKLYQPEEEHKISELT